MTEDTGLEEKPKRVGLIELAFLIIIILFLAILIGFSWVVSDVRDLSQSNSVLIERIRVLTKENETRIADIQASRVDSCKQTYTSIHDVFKPFFPPKPRKKAQQDLLDKFNNKIKELKLGCTDQTQPHPGD